MYKYTIARPDGTRVHLEDTLPNAIINGKNSHDGFCIIPEIPAKELIQLQCIEESSQNEFLSIYAKETGAYEFLNTHIAFTDADIQEFLRAETAFRLQPRTKRVQINLSTGVSLWLNRDDLQSLFDFAHDHGVTLGIIELMDDAEYAAFQASNATNNEASASGNSGASTGAEANAGSTTNSTAGDTTSTQPGRTGDAIEMLYLEAFNTLDANSLANRTAASADYGRITTKSVKLDFARKTNHASKFDYTLTEVKFCDLIVSIREQYGAFYLV